MATMTDLEMLRLIEDFLGSEEAWSPSCVDQRYVEVLARARELLLEKRAGDLAQIGPGLIMPQVSRF